MLISISEFATERNQDRDTVNAWIRNHDEVNKACSKRGKDKVIDTESFEYGLLCKQYPLPQMVQIIEDTQSMKDLIETQKKMSALQDAMRAVEKKLADSEKQLALADSQKLMIEERKQHEVDLLTVKLDNQANKITELEKALEEERNKTWLQKLFGK